MISRRTVITGLTALGVSTGRGWANAGRPVWLSAAKTPQGRFVLCGLNGGGEIVFTIPLPGRGHAAAAHPARAEAVVFARRPGNFAIVFNCATGEPITTLAAPPGRHFYGHGQYSRDGSLLLTTENDFETGQGRIGVWEVDAGYRRINEFSSGGIGPHDIKRIPLTDTFVVANGGIDTHPESGRTKLNLPTMRPNLSYIVNTHIVEKVELAPELHKNSIRHLAVSGNGQVAIGMQWQGDGKAPPLVGIHHKGAAKVRLFSATPDAHAAMDGYVGSIAMSHASDLVAVTSPKGGQVQVFGVSDGRCVQARSEVDVGGISGTADGFVVSAGSGLIVGVARAQSEEISRNPLSWDNHLVAI